MPFRMYTSSHPILEWHTHTHTYTNLYTININWGIGVFGYVSRSEHNNALDK